jgi:hypothetical protein
MMMMMMTIEAVASGAGKPVERKELQTGQLVKRRARPALRVPQD